MSGICFRISGWCLSASLVLFANVATNPAHGRFLSFAAGTICGVIIGVSDWSRIKRLFTAAAPAAPGAEE